MSELKDKKLERLASAIYLLTDFFDTQEPLRWKLRTLSADLISERIKDKSSIVKEILSLFSVAKTAGLVSEVNHDILARELIKPKYEVEKSLGLMFPHEKAETAIKDKIHEYDKGQQSIDRARSLKDFGAISIKKNKRQDVILGLIRRKKEVMIKDISPVIDGCSEKTVQRELSAMIRAGLLKKVGDKRWSRYSLTHT